MPKTKSAPTASVRPAPHCVLAGHIKRSELLNKFADLETEVTLLLDHLSVGYGNGSLGQKLKFLREYCSNLNDPKRLGKLVEDAADATEKRNAVVHAKLTGTNPKEGSQGWKFSTAGKGAAKPVIHLPNELASLDTKVRTLSNQFKQFREQQQAQASPGGSNAKS